MPNKFSDFNSNPSLPESDNSFTYWAEFAERFPIEYCRRHQILGLIGSDHIPRLLVTTETAQPIIDIVCRALGRPVSHHIVDRSLLVLKTNETYEQAVANKRAEANVPTIAEFLEEEGTETTSDDLLERDSHGEIVTLVNDLLLEAIQNGVSDIHLQPFEKQVIVRMRLDGVLEDVRTLPISIQDEVISRLKVAGKMNIAERRLPQDGRATVRVGDRIIDLRLASMPTSYGERMVVRLLDKSARLYRLSEIGMDGTTIERFRKLINVEHGLVLVTGPTGSGKSTTLYAALQELDTRKRNAVTLEDPIEYQLDGISQTQINTKKGMTFASGLRSVLRQDPDIIMVGEIRDQETAVMAVQAALTGHLVFSTLHTNDAASAVTRMLDLGIEPYLVASSVLGVLAQRLIRRLCPKCQGHSASASQLTAQPSETGCKNCRNSGYRGREGIYELLLLTDPIRQAIQDREHATHIRDLAAREGMQLLSQCGMHKVAQGLTTIEEVERVTMRTDL